MILALGLPGKQTKIEPRITRIRRTKKTKIQLGSDSSGPISVIRKIRGSKSDYPCLAVAGEADKDRTTNHTNHTNEENEEIQSGSDSSGPIRVIRKIRGSKSDDPCLAVPGKQTKIEPESQITRMKKTKKSNRVLILLIPFV